jgi:uncharacterized membrane protein (DUF485 family)
MFRARTTVRDGVPSRDSYAAGRQRSDLMVRGNSMSAPEQTRGLRADQAGVPFPGATADRVPAAGPTDYRAIRESPDFRELRRRTLRFAVPATAFFMANYLAFVLLSAYAPAFMGTPAIGAVNIGMLVGLFQFVSTTAVVGLYCRYARERTDPLVDAVRDRVEAP